MARMVPQDEFINSYKQDYTRAGWAARNAARVARQASVDASIVACFEELHTMCVEHAEKLQARAKDTKSDGNPAARAADNRLDRTFSSFVEKVKTEVDLYGVDSARGKAAQKMLDGPLSAPVHTVTNVHREEQEASMTTIVDELDRDHINGIKTCELEAHFGILKSDLGAFVDKMSVAHDSGVPTQAAIEASEEAIEAKFTECIWRAGGAYPTASRADMEMRSKLLGPFAIQNDKLAEFYRRQQGGGVPPVVDPDTGEEPADADSPQVDEPVVEA